MFKGSSGLLIGNFRYMYSSVYSFFLAKFRFTVISKDKKKRFEISNLELKRDINSIIKLGKILSFIE